MEFNLLPPSLEDAQAKKDKSTPAQNFETLYRTCFSLVYPNEQPDSLYRHKDAERRLNDIADEVGCSVRLYMLTAMIARRELAPESRFFANYLFAKNSAALVRDYGSLAKEAYGSFDYESLGMVTGGDQLTKDGKRLLDSEVLAGQWILGYKIRKPGSVLQIFYAENEIRLHPVWLCLEPSYVDYHNQLDGISQEIHHHRMEVRRIRRWLNKRRHVAVAYHEKRSKLFKQAVEEVLDSRGFQLDDFESAPIIHDAVKFWSRLALAIQHLGCLRTAGLID